MQYTISGANYVYPEQLSVTEDMNGIYESVFKLRGQHEFQNNVNSDPPQIQQRLLPPEYHSGRWTLHHINPSLDLYYSNDNASGQFYPPLTGWKKITDDTSAEFTITVSDDAPVLKASYVDRTGNILVITWDNILTLPVIGSTGMTLSNISPSATLSNFIHRRNQTIAQISRVIDSEEEPILNYAPGNFSDSSSTPRNLASATVPVVNFSGKGGTGLMML